MSNAFSHGPPAYYQASPPAPPQTRVWSHSGQQAYYSRHNQPWESAVDPPPSPEPQPKKKPGDRKKPFFQGDIFPPRQSPNRATLDAGQTYATLDAPVGQGVSYTNQPVYPNHPNRSPVFSAETGMNRVRAAFRFVSPAAMVAIFAIGVLWIFILVNNGLFSGMREFNAGTTGTSGQFDGQRRNEYTTVEPLKGTYTRNFTGSGLACDFFGIGCSSSATGVISKDRRRPYYVQDVSTGGFNILSYRVAAAAPSMSLGTAVSRSSCKGLTKAEAERYFCDRNINSGSWFRTATQTNDLCTTEVDVQGCPQWRACLNGIADTHFSQDTNPGFGTPQVADGRWLKFPADLDCEAVIANSP